MRSFLSNSIGIGRFWVYISLVCIFGQFMWLFFQYKSIANYQNDTSAFSVSMIDNYFLSLGTDSFSSKFPDEGWEINSVNNDWDSNELLNLLTKIPYQICSISFNDYDKTAVLKGLRISKLSSIDECEN